VPENLAQDPHRFPNKKERGLHHIERNVLAENEAAISGYEKAGYSKSHHKMRLKL